MPTSSVGRSAAAHKKDRLAAAFEKDRSTPAHKKDRTGLCSFTFADGRQCRTPRRAGHTNLCFYHARKEAQSLAAEEVGRDISSFLSGDYLSACDLSSALARLFSAVANGDIKPKSASTLAYLGQTLLQSIQLAEHEYINAFSTDSWRDAVRSSFGAPPIHTASTRRSVPLPNTLLPSTTKEFVACVDDALLTENKPSSS